MPVRNKTEWVSVLIRILQAAKSDTLAKQSFDLTTIRFKKGNVDVLKLTSSQKSKDNARLQYIQSLYQYWSYYYTVRKFTLYDFQADKGMHPTKCDLLY